MNHEFEIIFTKRYKMIDGSDVGYKRAVNLIKQTLVDDVEMSPTELTEFLQFQDYEFSFILPYLVTKNILNYRRAENDKLVYFKVRPNLLSEIFYPPPRFPEWSIKGIYIHKAK